MNHILGTIASSLELEVLPHLEGSDWVASRLRSSLMLLRHLELRVDREGPYLDEINQLAGKLLSEMLTHFAAHTSVYPVFGAIKTHLASSASDSGYLPLEALRDRNQTLMSLLDELIVTINDNRSEIDEALFIMFKRKIRDFFKIMNRKEGEMFAIGEGYSAL